MRQPTWNCEIGQCDVCGEKFNWGKINDHPDSLQGTKPTPETPGQIKAGAPGKIAG